MTADDAAAMRETIMAIEADIVAIQHQSWREPDVKDGLIRDLREIIELAEFVINKERGEM